MTADGPPPSAGPTVLIRDWSPGLKVLFDELRDAQVQVQRAPERQSPGLSLRTVRCASGPAWPMASLNAIARRRLGENDWTDSDSIATGECLVKMNGSAETSNHALGDRVFTVSLGATQGRAAANDAVVFLEAVWFEVHGDPALFYLSGEHLDEFGAAASVATGFSMVSFALTIPLQVVINQSVAIVDIASRVLDHPGVRQLLPDRDPDLVNEFLHARSNPSWTERFSSHGLTLGVPVLLPEHRSADAELAEARNAARLIIEAHTTDRWSSAHFSRLARV